MLIANILLKIYTVIIELIDILSIHILLNIIQSLLQNISYATYSFTTCITFQFLTLFKGGKSIMELTIFDFDCYENDIAAKRVENVLTPICNNIEGLWLYREPEIRTEGNELPTFTIVSPSLGICFIKVFSENTETLSSVENRYWIVDGVKVNSGIQKFRNYTHKIKSKLDDPLLDLQIDIPTKTFYIFPYLEQSLFDKLQLKTDEFLYTSNDLNITLPLLDNPIDKESYALLISVVQNASIINKSSNVYVDEPAQNMFEAIELNNKKIAQFDYDQMAASLTITEKPERIRGLAGSGKTVLLAMKAARLHKRFPEKKIAFVFFTKSLYNQATNLIRKYYNQIADDEPNWDNLKVLHSWGGITTGEGFYSYVCKEHGIMPKTLRQGDLISNCKELLEHHTLHHIFDCVLIDEAQDFPLEFFLLVERVTKPPKKIVIAYDELQTTNDIHIPEFDQLFGSNNGIPNVVLEPQYDYILKKSYRNTLDVLLTAFSFGFGFYHNITQIIQDNTTWEALGFECKSILKPGNEIIIHRPLKNSPNSISLFYPTEKPVKNIIYTSQNDQTTDIANKILHLINEQKVRPTDILVIDIRMNKTKALNELQYKLQNLDIDSHIPGVVSDARDFFVDNHITLTTPRNAKGNEVSVVFVIGCEDIYAKSSMSSQRQSRNFMFISITRSKGWVYLSAVGRIKGVFSEEVKKIQKNLPNMKFIYPSDDKIQELARIDFLTNNPSAKLLDENVTKLKNAISSGKEELLKQLLDLDPELKSSLRKLLEG